MAINIKLREDQDILQVIYSSGEVTKDDLAAQRNMVADELQKRSLIRQRIYCFNLARLSV